MLLREKNAENLAINLAIKQFYKKFRPVEFETHEKVNNWASAKITGTYLRKWTGLYLKEKEKRAKFEVEKLEREKLKTEDEIRREKKVKKKDRRGVAKKKVARKSFDRKKRA